MRIQAAQKLRFGPYKTPKYRLGEKVKCEVRGPVVIIDVQRGRIPWPLARTADNTNKMLVIYKDLAKAVRRESNAAVCYWWGVTPQTVSRWRGIMKVDLKTEAYLKLREEEYRKRYPDAWAKKQRKLAAVKAGKPLKRHSAATRKKMSEAHKRTGHRPPWLNPAWSAAEDALLRKFSTVEVCRRTGRTPQAVRQRRLSLGIKKPKRNQKP